MKAMFRTTMRNDRGITLIELLIVITIISILLGIAAISGKPWIEKYDAEQQMRMMHADLLQARAKAMEKNKLYFVQLNAGSYSITEDANDNGQNDDTPLIQKTLKWQAMSTLNITIDQRGLLTLPTVSAVSIQFNTGAVSPEFDCFQFYPTRISLGKWNGGSCVPR